MSLKDEAREVGMSEIQLNAVMGSLLGDACLRRPSNVAAPIRWNHSARQRDYVNAKYQLLREFATQPPFEAPNPGYGDTWCVLTLKSLGVFLSLHRMLYPNGHGNGMVLTKEYLDQIDHPIALAWWYLDDGSRQSGANVAVFHTEGYTKEEVELLQSWLTEKWEIESRILEVAHSVSKKKYWIISLTKNGFLRLSELVSLYTPDAMRYKTEVLMQTCPVCGKVIPKQQMLCCSEECETKWKTDQHHQYYLDHIDEHREKAKLYREAHKEELSIKKKEYEERRKATMTEEEKAERREKLRIRAAEDRANPVKNAHRNELRRQRRANQKGDPEYEAALKEERRRYYERLKADPERFARRQALAKARRQAAAEKKRQNSSSQGNTPSTGTES